MIDMNGHKLELCGITANDLEEVNAFFKVNRERNEISAVLWGEDLARVPILVYGLDGEILHRCPSLDDRIAAIYDCGVQMFLDAEAKFRRKINNEHNATHQEIVVLEDGETFSPKEGAKVMSVPAAWDTDAIEAALQDGTIEGSPVQ